MIYPAVKTPLIRLGNFFPDRAVYAKCEFVAPSGCFKIRGAVHLLRRLTETSSNRLLVVPSMGNTALGAAVAASEFGFRMVGVVPQTISRAKDEKLRALNVELIKIAGGGTDLLQHAPRIAKERGAYLVHPHLDQLWTDGYQAIVAEILRDLPECGSLVFPVGGGGLLMGLTEFLRQNSAQMQLLGCEAFNAPTYVEFKHARLSTIADGLILEEPHPKVQERIGAMKIEVALVSDEDIRTAMRDLHAHHALLVEPSSAITVAAVRSMGDKLAEPVCVVLTGENIARDDFYRLIAKV